MGTCVGFVGFWPEWQIFESFTALECVAVQLDELHSKV